MRDFFSNLTQLSAILAIVDILTVAAIFYWLLGIVGGTRAVPVLRGLVIILVASVGLGTLFQLGVIRLPTLNYLIQRMVLPGFVVAIPIIFQPELRRALERIGSSTGLPALHHGDAEEELGLIHDIADAVMDLASKHIGALIVIERETGLEDVADTGVKLDAVLNTPLLETIFTPNSPLHDGAVIVRGDRIIAAGSVLPLSDNLRVVGERGTRHRAALGITETSDAIAIVASEETGSVSVAQNGRLLSNFNTDRLIRFLSTNLVRS